MNKKEKNDYFKSKMRLSRANSQRKESNKSKKKNSAKPKTKETIPEPNRKSVSRASLYRKVKIIKETIPKHPHDYAECVTSLVDQATPQKKAALIKVGLRPSELKSPAERIVANLKKSIRETKKKPSNKHRRIMYSLVRSGAGNHWSLAKYLGTSWKVWKRLKLKKDQDSDSKMKKRLKGSIPPEVCETVKHFWLSSDISRPLPLRKRVKKKQVSYLLECSNSTAFKKFKQMYPNVKIGYVKFIQLRPKYVRPMKALERIMCCCVRCENVKLIVTALNIVSRKFGLELYLCPDAGEISKSTICRTKDKGILDNKNKEASTGPLQLGNFSWPDVNCLNNQCKSCGIAKFMKHYDTLREHGEENMKYDTWERVKKVYCVKGNDKECVSMERVTKSVIVQEVLDALEVGLNGLSWHIFRATWQQHQLKLAKEHMRPKSAVIIMDYAENYTASYQDETQAAHWSQNQVTIHPMMTFVNSAEMKGPATNKEAIIILSKDMKHDADGVNHFINMAHTHLIEKFHIKHFEHFSDCCAAQYRCSKSFMDLSMMPIDHGVSVSHNYFEPSHGKSSADGLGAIVKYSAVKAVTRRQYVIRDAAEFYAYCQKELKIVGNSVYRSEQTKYENSAREFMYVPKENIVRPRPEREANTVKGSQKIHCAAATGQPCQVRLRHLTCFCDGCMNGRPCSFQDLTGHWEQVTIQKKFVEGQSMIISHKLEI